MRNSFPKMTRSFSKLNKAEWKKGILLPKNTVTQLTHLISTITLLFYFFSRAPADPDWISWNIGQLTTKENHLFFFQMFKV